MIKKPSCRALAIECVCWFSEHAISKSSESQERPFATAAAHKEKGPPSAAMPARARYKARPGYLWWTCSRGMWPLMAVSILGNRVVSHNRAEKWYIVLMRAKDIRDDRHVDAAKQNQSGAAINSRVRCTIRNFECHFLLCGRRSPGAGVMLILVLTITTLCISRLVFGYCIILRTKTIEF